jgi:hypothetical protein
VAAAGGGSYEIARGLARFVRVRTTRCAAPGCRRVAAGCDLDHVVRWPEGPTCACNLAPLCRHHHGMKHERGWQVRWATDDARDSTLLWTSPLGWAYETRPEPLLRRSTGTHLPAESAEEHAQQHAAASYPGDLGPPPF